MFGISNPSRTQDTSKTWGQLVVPTLATSDTDKVLGVDASGHIVLRNDDGGEVDSSVFATRTYVGNQIDSYTFDNNVGLNWEIVDMPDSNRYLTNLFVNGVWVVLGLDTFTAQCYTTVDGVKYASSPSFPRSNPYDGTTYNNLAVVVSRSSWAGSPRIMTTPDGLNWTVRVNQTQFANRLQTIAAGGGRIIAFPAEGLSYLISYDGGYNWVAKSGLPITGFRDAVYLGDSIFIASGDNGVIRSTDGGETFTEVTMPESGPKNFYGATYDNGRAIVLCETCDTNKIFISDDFGATWSGDPQFAEANAGEFTRSILYMEAAQGWYVGVMYSNITSDSSWYVVRSRTANIGSWEKVNIPDAGLPYTGNGLKYGKIGGFHHVKYNNGLWMAVSVRGITMISGRNDSPPKDRLPYDLQNITNAGATTTNNVNFGGTVTVAGKAYLQTISGGTEDSALAQINGTGEIIKVPISTSTPTLQQVTTSGNTTTTSVTVAGLTSNGAATVNSASTAGTQTAATFIHPGTSTGDNAKVIIGARNSASNGGSIVGGNNGGTDNYMALEVGGTEIARLRNSSSYRGFTTGIPSSQSVVAGSEFAIGSHMYISAVSDVDIVDTFLVLARKSNGVSRFSLGTYRLSSTLANNNITFPIHNGVGASTTTNALVIAANGIETEQPTASGAGRVRFGKVLTGSDTNKYWEVEIDGVDYYIRALTALP